MFPINVWAVNPLLQRRHRIVSRLFSSVIFFLVMFDARSAGMSIEYSGQDSADQRMLLETYISTESKNLTGRDHDEILVMMLFFENFSCLPCLNDFMDFCDSLQTGNTVRPAVLKMLVIARNEQPLHQQAISMKRWTQENGIQFPLLCASRKLFDEWNIRRSTVLFWRAGTGILFRETLPLSPDRQETLLECLRKGWPK
jgi:hypothetical protein